MRPATILFVGVLLGASPAQAQAPTAAALFEQGRVALAAGDFDTACARFRASDQLDPQPGAAANLGVCEEQRGHLASAWRAYKAALEKMPRGDDRAPKTRERIAALEPRLARLVLALAPAASPSATVREGDAIIGTISTFGVAQPLDPGVHHLTVLEPGHASAALDVELLEGKTVTIAVEAGPADVVEPTPLLPAPTPAPSTSNSGGASPGPWIVGGLGVAGLVVGFVTMGLVLQDKQTAQVGCNYVTLTCTPDASAAARTGRILAPVSTIGLVAGAAGVVAGGLWLGLRRPSKASVALGVGPTVGGAAWRLEGSW